jgi:hypothetical protein
MTNRTFLTARAAAIFILALASLPVPSFAQEIGRRRNRPWRLLSPRIEGLARGSAV